MIPSNCIKENSVNGDGNSANGDGNSVNGDGNSDIDSPPSSPKQPPPPAAAAMLISANNHIQHTASASSYLSTSSLYSLFSWLGTSLYSLTNIPRSFTYSSNPEYDHEQVLTTIRKLHNHLRFLDAKIDRMNINTVGFATKAKKLYNNKKITSAMHQIRLKKMYDHEIQKLEALKFNIESQILHMDSVEIMMVTVDTIKDTSEYYQNIHSNINISQLENTLDEMVEHRDDSTDIQSILSDFNAFKESTYDEDELLNELKAMSLDTLTEQVSQSQINLADLPEAPIHPIHNNFQKNLEEIKKGDVEVAF